ncbi:hypothetical protein VTK73DRAFT_8156 [Phialemonium thermophilum]|uniref:C6 finger domain-containing protein n=1 Tax=Phialemonium thermophilum TaxID=223376 RepID=A0ABR3WA04_9PEZI
MSFEFNATNGGEAALLEQFAFDQRDRYPYSTVTPSSAHQTTFVSASTGLSTMSQGSRQSLSPTTTWLPLDLAGGVAGPACMHSPNASSASSSSPDDLQNAQSPEHHSSASSSPLQQQQHSPFSSPSNMNPTPLLSDWPLNQQQQQQSVGSLSPFMQETSLVGYGPFNPAFQPSSIGYLPPTTQAALEASLRMDTGFNNMTPVNEATTQAMQWGVGMMNWHDLEQAMNFHSENLPLIGSLGSNSPTGTYLEVVSLGSGSDSGWNTVDAYPSFDAYQQAQQGHNAAIFNPGQTLHLRTNSDSSQSDGNSLELGSYEEVTFPFSPYSPGSDTFVDSATTHRHCPPGETHHHSHEVTSPTTTVAPVPIKSASPTSRPASGSGSGSTSPPSRRNSGPKKSPIAKATKHVIRRNPTNKRDGTGEKKVGRRRGPLLPEQRKQASEIRKLRACLRCKFLKKTCDKGEPCAGCQPSHARLWQVPCTRIDIKDIGYFMKDWKADYERHLDLGVSVYNVKGFAQKETLMWITHGYGFCLPVMVREVYVVDDSRFEIDWVESHLTDQDPIEFAVRTERLDVGHEGISTEALSEYLDKHIDGPFENFIDDHFEGTPFITEILKTAHRFYMKEKLPIIRKALKLVLAYNLTLHITMIEQPVADPDVEGQIDDDDSKYYGRVVAPVMVNFQIKCAMADMWRELQRDILEELSALYSSVYSGDRLKNWPTIFMLASILLAVWEEMQFDCHYRVPDPSAVEKFCSDMESTPVGVIVGLFHAISQKLPPFTEWDSRKHGQLLNNNVAVCEAMTEVRQHVLKHEAYLRTRQDTKFDRYDFDSLSNKFLSKLVIRAS